MTLARRSPRLVVLIGTETYSGRIQASQLRELVSCMGSAVAPEVCHDVETSHLDPHDTYMVCFKDRTTPELTRFVEQVAPLLSEYRDSRTVRALAHFLNRASVPAVPRPRSESSVA